MENKRIITKPILILSLVSLFTDVASEMLYPIMPVYLKSIGFSVLLIGILEGLAESVAGFSKGYFGHLSDYKRQRVPFIRSGYGLSAIAKPLLAIFSFPWWVFLARTLDRLGKGIRTSARDALLSENTTPEYKGRVFGFHRSLDTLGAAIGPSITLLLLLILPGQYRLLFVLSFIPGLLAIMLTLLIKEKRNHSNHSQEAPSFWGFLGYWKVAPKTYKHIVTGLLLFTLFNSSDVFLLLALKEKGYSDTAMIGFYIFYNVVYALLSYPIGKMADRIGRKRVMIGGLLLFCIVYSFFGFVSSIPAIILLYMLYGGYSAATEGISKAIITNIASEETTATALGFFNAFSSIATLLASVLGGFIWYSFSSKHMFVISGIGAFIATLYLTFKLIKSQPPQSENRL
ncbi:MAG: MFS transporter [Bacteroidota bacterium]|nr:MFS transporter [Bacteroidota bacterium]